MPLFEKLTHIGNHSKSDSSFKSEKLTHNNGGNHKSKPLFINKKLDNNSKMNKVETNKCISQHEVCDIGGSTGDIFKQLHLLILPSFNLFVSIRIN